MKYYTLDIKGFEAQLPILPLPSGISIAFFNLHGDNELTEHCGKELAKELQYTPEHLNRIIRLYSDITLAELLAQKRVEKIKAYALEGGYTLAELAKLFDFYSPELLRKYFHYHTGKNVTDFLRN